MEMEKFQSRDKKIGLNVRDCSGLLPIVHSPDLG